MTRPAIAPLLLMLALAACSDGGGPAAADSTADHETGTLAVDSTADHETGTLAVRLEEIDGVFIEGFEIGLRVETPDGEVLDALLWTDFVASLDRNDIDAYYDSVYVLDVPAGDIVVLADVNVGMGPAPSVPDLESDLPCRLVVHVPPGGRVEVQATFDDSTRCLRPVEDPVSE